MQRLAKKVQNLARRRYRSRSRMNGTSEQPRMTVFISNQHISVQVIDDTKQTTLAYATTIGNKKMSGTMTERAVAIGKEIAAKSKAAKVKSVVFDRNGRLYHGRIKALADAARAGGLEF